MKLSVVVCTYNREKNLYNLLKSISENDFPKELYEIVLINNNSSDGTEKECFRFQTDFPDVDFQYVKEEKQGLSFARNRGIMCASGDVLIYVDDDALVNRDYLKTYYDFFEQNPLVEAAGGAIIPLYETSEPVWMTFYTKQLLTAYLYKGENVKPFGKGEFPGGGNAAYRRSVFDEIGLFNTDLGRKGSSLASAEEKDVFERMRKRKMKIFYLPKAILYHIIPKRKLEKKYFNQLTYEIGKSERQRTLSYSRLKFAERLFVELLKWGATCVLFLFYLIKLTPKKGGKLLIFRRNVTKGLLGINVKIS